MISGTKVLRSALCFMALLALMSLISMSATSFAQEQAATSATDEKIQELIRLLDDPDVRAAIESAQTKAAPADDTPEAAEQIAAWESGIRGHLQALRNTFPRIPGEIANAVQVVRTQINNHGFGTVLILLGGLIALGYGAEWLFRRAVFSAGPSGARPAAAPDAGPRSTLAVGLLSEVAPVAVFALVSAGVFLSFSWPPLLRRVVMTYLVAFIVVRLVMAIGRILLAPDAHAGAAQAARRARLVSATDAAARFWYRRLVLFTGYFMLAWATVSLLPALGFSPGARDLLAYLAGIGLLIIAIEIVWRRPHALPTRQSQRIRNWLLTLYLVVLWGVWVSGTNSLLWLGIYALLLPRLLTITGNATASAAAAGPDAAAPATSYKSVMLVRGARALVILLAVLWLAYVWRLNPNALTESDTAASRVMRGLLQGVIVLLLADLIWHLAKTYIGRKLEEASSGGAVSPAEAARRGRLRTLLPIFRNLLGVFIATVAVLIFLSGLGVQIGPLIAGAGIFGVAIGFGSQTLVKDVLSGVFYMLDDAFRVGEYIQSGSYKGTVESFSLRSVKLRHHRGPVFTVPFGDLGAVQNMSRDWVIDKFMIRVPFDTDVQKVKKLVKGIGAELKEDPELGPEILETVKMKGVEEIGDFGIQLSFAFMAKPGHQSVVRRRAYTMIRQAFNENGIEFAQPTVQVGGDEKAAAAAATTTSMMRKKAAEAVQA
jgi:small-conductance mechanosensitive channel